MILVPPISPIAFSIFGFDVRWYALAYVAAFVVGFWLLKRLLAVKPPPAAQRGASAPPLEGGESCLRSGAQLLGSDTPVLDSPPSRGGADGASLRSGGGSCVSLFNKKSFDDLFAALIFGVILGGRLGYVLFYNLGYFINHPLEIFAVWNGGMSFHGGLLGVVVAVFIFAWRKSPRLPREKIRNAFGILDALAVVAPIGLFFGRIANFINMEVMGRETAQPWGVIFDGTNDYTPRHPSPLYEAALEGLLLFVIMNILWHFTKLRERAGALSGIFTILYALFRIFAEQFRAPDVQLGFLTSWGLTMGMLLSGGMLVAGALILVLSIKKLKTS